MGYTLHMVDTHYPDEKRYVKEYKLVETDTELPIQGQVRDPKDLYVFFKNLQDERMPKIIGIYLDNNHLFLGHQVFLGATPTTFNTQQLYHYYNLFLAKKFILLLNHPSDGPTPTKEDTDLMESLRMDSKVLSFKPSFADYVIVGDKSYYSMAMNDGSACRCGHQEDYSEA